MKKINLLITLMISFISLSAQHAGIVRKNYYTTYFDSLTNSFQQQFDSATIRIGSLNPITGLVTNVGNDEYNMGISLAGATVNPYTNLYYVSNGNNLLAFDLNNGSIVSNSPISGPFQTSAFQNFRLNPSDTTIYGFVPNNYYSTYFDSLTMTTIQVLDSSKIHFSTINPTTGQYTLLGNANLDNFYSLAGNSIDPHQMIYYYSAVDTLVGIDLYTGAIYSQTSIQLPPNAYFENFTYSCADTSIYGLTRQNYFSTVYDSILQQYINVFDSASIRLSKINPTTGAVTIISPYSLALSSTLNGSCFIDPTTMTYYFSTGANIVGVSLSTGLITSSVVKTFQAGAMYLDLMRSTQNCLGAPKIRTNNVTNISQNELNVLSTSIYPNPASTYVAVQNNTSVSLVEISDLSGKILMTSSKNTIDISTLPTGMYIVKIHSNSGLIQSTKLIKN